MRPRSMWVDPGRRRLIAVNSIERNFYVVDLDTMQQIGHFAAGTPSDSAASLDMDMEYVPEFGTLLYGRYRYVARPPFQEGDEAEGCDAPLVPTVQGCMTLEDRGLLWVVDVVNPGGPPTEVRLNAAGPAPGARIVGAIRGMAYDAEEHVLYVAEDPAVGASSWESFNTPPAALGGILVHAFRNHSHGPEFDDLEHLWVRQLTGCMWVKDDAGVARDSFYVNSDGVPYVLCQPIELDTVSIGEGGVSLPTARIGEAGIGQLIVEDGHQRDVTRARVVFHPLPANIRRSAVLLDRVGHRMVVTSSGRNATQAFIFDGERGAWIGAAPLTPAEPRLRDLNAAQADPTTGRLYILEAGNGETRDGSAPPGSGIRIVDPAFLPIDVKPDAQVYRYPGVQVNQATSAFDPITRRLFLQTAGREIRVLQDRTPPLVPPPPENPDANTNDLDEAEAATVERVGGATGYGARLHLGGGVRGGVQEFFIDHEAWAGDPSPEGELQGARPARGDRGHFFGRVEQVHFDGGRDRGESEARAVGMAFPTQEDGGYNDPTERELQEGWDEVTGQIIGPLAGERPAAEACDPDVPSHDCLAYDALADRVGERFVATCRARGFDDDRPSDRQDGAVVACSDDGAEARAASSEAMTDSPLRIGYASSHASSRYVPDKGVVTTVDSVARGVELDVLGMGSLRIGEVRQTARSWANGRPGGADSEYEWSANAVRIADAAGDTVWACGTEGPDDRAGQCDSVALTDAINRAFQTRVYAKGPRVDEDPTWRGSPGGARAAIRKDPVARENDTAVHGDQSREAAGLDLMIVNDSAEVSRIVVQLAGVYAESQYRIGPPAPPIEPLGPASLTIELVDDLGEALAGGMFEVRSAGDLPDLPVPDPVDDPADSGADDGENGDGAEDGDGAANGEGNGNGGFEAQSTDLDDVGGVLGLDDELVDGAVCVTAADGVGDCVFEDLEPGRYQVIQTAAPDGYFPAEPYLVDAFPGFDTVVTFTNMRAVGGVEINLTDDADPPEPLAGGEFTLLAGGTDEVGRCTTGAEGTCGFADVPLDDYVVRQKTAPDGRLTADDIPFTLDQPGQVAVLNIVNGFEGVDAVAGAATPSIPFVEPVTFQPGPTPPEPIVRRTESAPPQRSGLGQVLAIPGDVLGFIARRPLEAALIIGVWLLLAAPAYLAARRRSLVLAKGVM